MYVRKIYEFQDSREVEEFHNFRYGAPGLPREKKKKATKEQITKQNKANREKKIRRKIKANFKANDYYTTLTYRSEERPGCMVEAKEHIRKFLRKLRSLYKKVGVSFKWMLTTEMGTRGAVHHHLIMNRIPDLDIFINSNWQQGGAHNSLLYTEGGFKKLAGYFSKDSESNSDPNEGGEQRQNTERKGQHSYSCSRNLIIIEPKVVRMPGRTWRKDVRVPKGYHLEKDTYHEGVNEVTGYPYRSYTLIKL